MGQARRRRFLIAAGAFLAAPLAYAQPRMRRVAIVAVGDVKRQPLASLVQGLRHLGYEEGRNLELLPPATVGGYPALVELAARAVKREAEVVITYGSTATRAAKAATWTVPIVMVIGVDPVEQGFVRTYARPEGNITGIAISSHILSVKRIELLKEVLPAIRRFGVLWSAESASQAITLKHMQTAATRVGLDVHAVEVSEVSGLEAAFKNLSDARVEALIPVASAWLTRETALLVRLVSAHRIPAIYSSDIAVHAGGLMSYGPDYSFQFRHAAELVDRILKGAKPAEMPIEQPTKFEMVINLKTANALGIDIPKSVLFRADEVIQ